MTTKLTTWNTGRYYREDEHCDHADGKHYPDPEGMCYEVWFCRSCMKLIPNQEDK